MSQVRTVFVSDAHLGCRFTHADALLAFLKTQQPQYLYLVGDIIDGWRLQRTWYWNDTYTYLLKHIVEMMKKGTRVYYTPGNHDEFLRSFIENFGSVHLADEFVHTTADGRRLLVTHGDKFDAAVHHAPWLSKLGDVGYNLLLGLNTVFNAARRRLGFGYWSLSSAIKRKVKQATSFIGNFEAMVTRHAAQLGCEGVVCGHIHTPKISQRDGVCYYNTGDWVESCTALVEYADGRMELLHRPLNQWGAPPPGTLDRSDGKRPHPDVTRGPVSESKSNESPPFRHAGVFDFAGSVTTPEPAEEGVPQEPAAVTTA